MKDYYEAKGGGKGDFWKLFWLVLEMKTVLAIVTKAQIWAKYLVVIIKINITATNIPFPWRIMYHSIIYCLPGIQNNFVVQNYEVVLSVML